MKPRIEWPDALKGLGIITVFFGHLGGHFHLMGSEIGITLFKFCAGSFVAAFFTLSGYFWKDRGLTFLAYMKNRARARLVPVLAFHVIGIVLVLLAMAASNQLNAQTLAPTMVRAAEIVKGWPWFNPVSWALVTLFTMETAQFFLARVTKTVVGGLAVCAACVFLIWAFPLEYPALQQSKHLQGWWNITPATALMVFYQVGVMLRRWRFPERLPRAANIALAGAAFIVLIFTFDLNQGPFNQLPQLPIVAIGFSQFGDLRWFFFNSLLGALCMLAASQLMAHFNWLTELGRHTAVLMCLNSYFLLLVDPIVGRILYVKLGWNSPAQVLLMIIAGTVLSILICLPMAWFIDRRAPWMAGRGSSVRPPARPQVAPPTPPADLVAPQLAP